MPAYRFYVRGHGGQDGTPLQPARDLPIDVITIGQVGSTMSDEVADSYIYGHIRLQEIVNQIQDETIIYWTRTQRDNWYDNGVLQYSNPGLYITSYETLVTNLALDGDATLGECGVCYYNEQQGALVWVVTLADGETILLRDILVVLESMLNEGDSIELYWTACMSAQYFSGTNKKVSFHPDERRQVSV
jgi:hypothetical protein